MTMSSKFISTVIGEKGQWREYKARVRQLPASYRTAVDALERYLKHFGTGGGGTAIYEDLIDLFEQSAANGTPIRETFVRNYPKGQWIIRERERLTNAIERAAVPARIGGRARARNGKGGAG
jgi:DNA-binding ferritin-like protein (Dps family)